jgi:hypothetical protein
MKQYRTREGDVTAVDTRTALTTVGSETAPGPLLVPQSAKYIVGVIVSHISSMAAATGYSAFIRIEGPGLSAGPQTMAIGAGGMAVATGGNACNPAKFLPLNLEVVPAQEIQLFAEMAGTDVGQLSVSVTVVFADALPSGEAVNQTFTVEGDITAADTRYALTTQGSVTAPSSVTPSTAKTIRRIISAVAGEALADGSQTFIVRLGGNAVKGGEQVLTVGASGRIAVQSGSDAAPQLAYPIILDDLEIEVSPSDTISVTAEGPGTDTGTPHMVVTLIYE